MRGKCGSDTSLVLIIIRFFRFTFNIILQIVTDPEQVLKDEARLWWHILQLNHKVLQRHYKRLLANELETLNRWSSLLFWLSLLQPVD